MRYAPPVGPWIPGAGGGEAGLPKGNEVPHLA